MRSAVVAKCAFGLLVVSLLSYGTPVSTDYSHKSVTELIDDLTQVESESVVINSDQIVAGFIADETPASLRTNRYGVILPDAPPAMRELVRRGPLALPELIKHLEDRRATKLDVGNPPPGSTGVFVGKFFGDDYAPRVYHSEPRRQPHWTSWAQRGFLTLSHEPSAYTLRVGDLCYALIGQIVNRRLVAVEPVPTGMLIVNSPIESRVLVEELESDWGTGDVETLKASLLADIYGTNDQARVETAVDPKQRRFEDQQHTKYIVNPALRRLRQYFPDAYAVLDGDDLQKKKAFEGQEIK
jgi:hypothetical protein